MTVERKSALGLLMRKCFRQIQSILLPVWLLRSQQVNLTCTSFLLKNNRNNKKGIAKLQEGK